ncbi:MAG: phasin family protein [Methylovirgula sp.]
MQHEQSFAAGATSDPHIVPTLVSPMTSQFALVAGDFPAAAENMRRLAGTFADLSATSLERTRCLFEDVRGARHMNDLVAIQAKYVTAMLQSFTEGSRRIGSLLADLPRDMTQASCDMFEASVEAAHDVADIATTTLAAANVANQIDPIDVK